MSARRGLQAVFLRGDAKALGLCLAALRGDAGGVVVVAVTTDSSCLCAFVSSFLCLVVPSFLLFLDKDALVLDMLFRRSVLS